MAKRVRKLDNGAYAVSLQVTADVIRFAMKQARAGGYVGPADYLNGVFNTAMLGEMEDEPLSKKQIEARRKAIEESDDDLPF